MLEGFADRKVFDDLPGYFESRGLPPVGEAGNTSLAELLSR